jgi:hypothetical protein
MLDPHQAQKHFLGQIGCIGSVAQSLGKETQQSPAVTAYDLGSEGMPRLCLQLLS